MTRTASTHVAACEVLLPCLCSGPSPSWTGSSSRAEGGSDSYVLFSAQTWHSAWPMAGAQQYLLNRSMDFYSDRFEFCGAKV